ncbi:transmembrane protein 47 isoform X2 [Homalodisca vitripennis]|nr:transmembrane protein 47 isoform X2 [Homalodisca vitripennis]
MNTDPRKVIAYGNTSFDGDSLPEFSEFDSDSIIEGYHRESSLRPPEDTMAPTTTIETITITRPLKVIAFVCGLIVVVLLIMALASTDWLMAAGYRQGLFNHCIGENAPTPLPFHIQDKRGECHKGRDMAYIKVAAALCIVALITDAIATLLTGLGLRSKDHRTKYKYYRVAVYVMIASLVATLLALVVYPVCFAAELTEGNRQVWEFGWAYGVGWGAAIFLFGAVVLLLCDKESEEIYYKERKVTA